MVDEYRGQPGTGEHPRLYRNNHDGTFTDVTDKAGVAGGKFGMGVAAADYDGDGNIDLYVTNYGSNILYRNNGDGTFTDVTEKAGVTAPGWSTCATWFDYDNDAKLDLFVIEDLVYSFLSDAPPLAATDPTRCIAADSFSKGVAPGAAITMVGVSPAVRTSADSSGSRPAGSKTTRTGWRSAGGSQSRAVSIGSSS